MPCSAALHRQQGISSAAAARPAGLPTTAVDARSACAAPRPALASAATSTTSLNAAAARVGRGRTRRARRGPWPGGRRTRATLLNPRHIISTTGADLPAPSGPTPVPCCCGPRMAVDEGNEGIEAAEAPQIVGHVGHHLLYVAAEPTKGRNSTLRLLHCALVRGFEELHNLLVCQALLTAADLIVVSTYSCDGLPCVAVVQIVANAHCGVAHCVSVHAWALALVFRDQRTGVAGVVASRRIVRRGGSESDDRDAG